MNLEREISDRKSSGRRRKRSVQRIVEPDFTPKFFVDKRKYVAERAASHLQNQVSLLAAQERKIPADKKYSSSGDIVQMIDAFSQEAEFRSIVDECRRSLSRGGNYQDVRSDMNGALFENLVYRILKAESPEGLDVLSPDRAFKIARMLYPYGRENNNGHSKLHGLMGENVYVPDGFIYSDGDDDSGLILASIEASIFTQERKFNVSFKNKYSRFRHAKRSFGELTRGMQMMVVIPDNGFTPVIAKKSDVALVKLDFNSQEFSSLVGAAASL